jgi:hypothetical protein
MGLKQWLCIDCWHEVLSDPHRQPQSIHWSDGHICTFKSPEDMPTDRIISFDKLLEGLHVSIGKEKVIRLREAYDTEVTMMVKYALKARLPEIILWPFRTAGSQHIAEFEVKDLSKENNAGKVNWHMQNTSQWVYAGCILYDDQDHRVTRHH